MTRRHDIDALRALAFALLILYHLAMMYVTDWDWHIKSHFLAGWLQWPMLLVNRWRMDLVFLISGISAAFLLRPGAASTFVRSRSHRLLLPLLFGILVIVPLQPYVEGVTHGTVQPGWIGFLRVYFSGARWPVDAFAGWEHGYTWNHLWYLAYLWIFSLTLALLSWPLNSRAGQRLQSALLERMRGWRLLVLPALPLLFYTLALQERFPDQGDFIHDWYRNCFYFTVFAYGFLIAKDEGFWKEASRLRKVSLATAVTLGGTYLALVAVLPDDSGAAVQAGVWTIRNLYVWTTLLAILGWSRVLLDRPFRWLTWANEAVFPWYVLHQSVIVLLAYGLVPMQLGPILEPVLMLAATVAACALIFELVRRIAWLRPLFGMKPSRAGKPIAVDRPTGAAYS